MTSTTHTQFNFGYVQRNIIKRDPRIREIGNINEILPIINDLGGKRVICAFDWDNTISLRNGCNVPLRDGNITIETMDTLNKMHVIWFIATSRYAGVYVDTPLVEDLLKHHNGNSFNIFNECIKMGVKEKYVALPPLAEQARVGYVGLNPTDIIGVKLADNNSDTALIYGNIVYCGSHGKYLTSNKGRAFVKLMAEDIIPSADMFDVFIFVDNDIEHIKAVIKEFDNSGFGDKLFPIYYPQVPNTLAQDESCGSIFDIQVCLSGK